MRRWDLVIFDLDGTLLDTIDDLGSAVNYAMSRRGFPIYGREEHKLMVGHGIRNLVNNALPEEKRGDETLLDECLSDFRNYYNAHIDDRTRPYGGVVELVGALAAAGVKVAVASNKFQAGTERLVAKFFPDVEFAAVFGNSESLPLKPDARVVEMIMERAGVERDRSVMVGDSRTDMQTAANGGITGIAVSWGFRSRADLESATPFVVDSIPELARLLM